MNEELLSALGAIDVATLNHADWIAVGMALKAEGLDCSTWDNWSKNDTRYHPGECEKRWKSFGSSGVTVKTIYKIAYDRGWHSTGGALSWNDVIDDGDAPVIWARAKPLEPGEQVIAYLKALFEPDDHVAYVTSSFKGEDGKYRPEGGVCVYTAGQLVESIGGYGTDAYALGNAIGDYDPEAGAWICVNPVDGKGRHNENVTAYRHVLVESDTIPVDEQERVWRELGLPIAAMVGSGGKSIHAIVRVEAKDADEYRERVTTLYKWLADKGIEIDTQNKNPARLSRLPGVTRGGKEQRLIGVNIGPAHWADWPGATDDELPPFELVADVIDDPPELAPELIHGVLRRGHKMLIAGASKAGKSFLLMELAVAISHGWKWLKFECERGKVLYINLEIDKASAVHRIIDIYDALGAMREQRVNENLYTWNIRGKAMTLDKLADRLIWRVQHGRVQFDAIIFDPLYKIMIGDENSASDMGAFCNYFDTIADALGCSVIYCHHHSKGAQGQKKAIDRASGSGVFARDPDAQLDIIELELSGDEKLELADRNADGSLQKAFRIECNLREFAPFRPFNIWFKWPLHVVDDSGLLDKAKADTEAGMNAYNRGKKRGAEDSFREAWHRLEAGTGCVSVRELAIDLGVSERTIRERVKGMSSDFRVENSNVYRPGMMEEPPLYINRGSTIITNEGRDGD